jgi:hypothetical protein
MIEVRTYDPRIAMPEGAIPTTIEYNRQRILWRGTCVEFTEWLAALPFPVVIKSSDVILGDGCKHAFVIEAK